METIVTAVLTVALVVIAYSVSAKNSTKPSAPARTNEQSKPVQIKCGTEFTQEEMNEARLNATGKKTASISVVAFGVFGVIALITDATIFWVALIASALGICMGIVWLMQNRSEAVIIQDKIEAQKKAAAFVSNLVNNNFDTSSLYEKPNTSICVHMLPASRRTVMLWFADGLWHSSPTSARIPSFMFITPRSFFPLPK